MTAAFSRSDRFGHRLSARRHGITAARGKRAADTDTSEIGRVATDGDKATVAVAIGLRRVQQTLAVGMRRSTKHSRRGSPFDGAARVHDIDAFASRGHKAEIVADE